MFSIIGNILPEVITVMVSNNNDCRQQKWLILTYRFWLPVSHLR
jgi:hypothetical protein